MGLIQKQIEKLRKEAELFREPRRDCPGIAKMLDDAADTIEMLSGKLRTASLDNGWILVSERLPENYDDVLICDGYGVTKGWCDEISRWFTEDEEWQNGFDNTVLGIIAWQPLPKSYKED